MQIIPAIDIFQGKYVFLTQGKFTGLTVYSDSPADVAKSFIDTGFTFLHIVDLEGAKNGQVANWNSIEAILSLHGVKAEIGGGVRTKEEMQRLLQLGAQRVIVGSIAVTLPSLVKKWIQDIGTRRLAIALDIHNGKIAHSGWMEASEYSPNTFLFDTINAKATTFICTDVERDGMLEGPNLDLYNEIRQFFKAVELVACGGVTSVQDVQALAELGVNGVIVGKAIYERKLKLVPIQLFFATNKWAQCSHQQMYKSSRC